MNGIDADCKKFAALYRIIANNPPSGTTEEDWRNLAAEQFEEVHKRPFQYLACWKELRLHPCWDTTHDAVKGSGSRKHPAQGNPLEGVDPALLTASGGGNVQSVVRPGGSKKAKRSAKESDLTARSFHPSYLPLQN